MITLSWMWTCDVCGNTEIYPKTQEMQEVGNCYVMPGNVPSGWSLIRRAVVCPNHVIAIDSQIENTT